MSNTVFINLHANPLCIMLHFAARLKDVWRERMSIFSYNTRFDCKVVTCICTENSWQAMKAMKHLTVHEAITYSHVNDPITNCNINDDDDDDDMTVKIYLSKFSIYSMRE